MELKPCPFCNGSPTFREDDYRNVFSVCRGCGSNGRLSKKGIEDCKDLWNRRPIEDALLARAVEAERKLDEFRDNELRRFLEWRGIDEGDACHKCGGSGRHTYPNTSTWVGGIGGQALTEDVCDSCWGTGSATKKGADLRQIWTERKTTERAEAQAERDRLRAVVAKVKAIVSASMECNEGQRYLSDDQTYRISNILASQPKVLAVVEGGIDKPVLTWMNRDGRLVSGFMIFRPNENEHDTPVTAIIIERSGE